MIAVARAFGVGTQNGTDSWQRGIQLGVFIDNVRILILFRFQGRVRNHYIINGYGIVFVSAVAAVIHDSIRVRESDVVHVAAFGAKMHSFLLQEC
jgi:hypothetical protein